MSMSYTSRIVPITYAGYRTCVHCDGQFWPEEHTQVMHKTCQVELSTKATKDVRTVICQECGHGFTTSVPKTTVRYCSDECRNARGLKRKAAAAAAKKGHEPIPQKVCVRTGCDTVFTPTCGHAIYCSRTCQDKVRRERERGRYPKRVPNARVCKRTGCETVFTPGYAHAKYCSNKCKGAAQRERAKAGKEAMAT